MRRLFPTEFVFQIFSLLISFIVVHAYYVAIVRPNSDVFFAEARVKMQLDPNYQVPQSLWVILKDYEQEACIVLMFWAFAILGYKAWTTWRQRQLLALDLVGLPEGTAMAVDSAQQTSALIRKRLPEEQQDYLLPRAMLAAIDRFSVTRSVQDASGVVHMVCDAEAGRMDSELSIIRYIAWAIPSLGFIGTVRGIGDALLQINKAMAGDVSGVIDSLGTAFNSTLIALLVSIVLMFIIHWVQSAQEQLVLETRRYCDDWFVRRLRA